MWRSIGVVLLSITVALIVNAPVASQNAKPGGELTQRVIVGPISIRVPSSWTRREGPEEDNPHFDAPGPTAGLGPSVAIAIDDDVPAAGEEAVETRTIAGHAAELRHWQYDDPDSRGVTVAFRGVLPGKRIQVMGWTLARDWQRRSAEIWRIIDTIEIADAGTASRGDPQPTGPVKIISVGNTSAVVNGPTKPAMFKLAKPRFIRSIRTYHWNFGRGTLPGSIRLRDASGRVHGPWPARGEPGQGGVANAYWKAEVGEVLPPGTYTVVTSQDWSWATNDAAGQRGFFDVEWQALEAKTATGADDAVASDVGPRHPPPQPPAEGTPVAAPPDAQGVIFSGPLGTAWKPLATAGGNFERFARAARDGLVVDVPAGNAWGKTGIVSAAGIVPVPADGTPEGTRLALRFDPAATSSFAVTLAGRADGDEWNSQDVRFAWSAEADGQRSKLTVWVRQVEVMSAILPLAVAESLTVSLSPDGFATAEIADGGIVEARLPPDLRGKRLFLSALAHAPGVNNAARMSLRSIALEPLASPAVAAGAAEQVLFEGRLAGRWRPLSAAGGDFSRFARVDGRQLLVDVPAGHGWGKTGLVTRERTQAPAVAAATMETLRYRFEIEPDKSTGFVVALAASEGDDEWSAHDIRFAWTRDKDGKAGAASLAMRQNVVARVATGPVAPDAVECALSGDGAAACVLPDGTRLEAMLPDGVATQGYRVMVLAHPSDAQLPASLLLRRVTLHRSTAERQLLPVVFPDPRERVVLFDGTLGTLWEPFGIEGGRFAGHARIGRDGVSVDVPAGQVWGKAGITSRDPMVWLRGLSDDAEYDVTFELGAERTDGFNLTLALPGRGSAAMVTYQWIRGQGAAKGRATLAFIPESAATTWTGEVAAEPPSSVRMRLRRGEITVTAAGMDEVTRPWSFLDDDIGLRIIASARAPEANAPVRFAMKRIVLERRAGKEPGVPAPSAGVAPPRVSTLFDGMASAAWEAIGVAGADFAKHAKFESGRLIADTPADTYTWGKTGLLSKDRVIRRDERIHHSPIRIAITVDPRATTGLLATFSFDRVADMWPRRNAAFHLIKALTGRYAGHYMLGIDGSGYAWTLPVHADFIEREWSGTLDILVGPEWAGLRLDGGPAMRLPGVRPNEYMAIVSHPETARGAGRLALKRIERSFVVPDGMSKLDYWILADDQDFDAATFWNDIGGAAAKK